MTTLALSLSLGTVAPSSCEGMVWEFSNDELLTSSAGIWERDFLKIALRYQALHLWMLPASLLFRLSAVDRPLWGAVTRRDYCDITWVCILTGPVGLWEKKTKLLWLLFLYWYTIYIHTTKQRKELMCILGIIYNMHFCKKKKHFYVNHFVGNTRLI